MGGSEGADTRCARESSYGVGEFGEEGRTTSDALGRCVWNRERSYLARRYFHVGFAGVTDPSGLDVDTVAGGCRDLGGVFQRVPFVD